MDPGTIIGLSMFGAAFVGTWWGWCRLGREFDEQNAAADRARVPELELWNQLWIHPSISDAFYTWSEDTGYTERGINDALKRFIGWSDLSVDSRSVLQRKVGSRGDGCWGRETKRAVMKHGLWETRSLVDGLKEAETASKNRRAQLRKEAEVARITGSGKRVFDMNTGRFIEDRGAADDTGHPLWGPPELNQGPPRYVEGGVTYTPGHAWVLKNLDTDPRYTDLETYEIQDGYGRTIQSEYQQLSKRRVELWNYYHDLPEDSEYRSSVIDLIRKTSNQMRQLRKHRG